MEPIRVKVYGLFTRTRRRYLLESMLALGLAAGLLVAWWLGWPVLRDRLDQHHQKQELPVAVQVAQVGLELAPWILFGAMAFKLLEMTVVLRRFAYKEAIRRGGLQ